MNNIKKLMFKLIKIIPEIVFKWNKQTKIFNINMKMKNIVEIIVKVNKNKNK